MRGASPSGPQAHQGVKSEGAPSTFTSPRPGSRYKKVDRLILPSKVTSLLGAKHDPPDKLACAMSFAQNGWHWGTAGCFASYQLSTPC